MFEGAVQFLAGVFGLLFLVAGLSKVDSWSGWSVTLSLVLPLGHPAYPIVRIGFPMVEIATGILTMVAPRVGLQMSASLLFFFALAVSMLIPRYRGQECGCFGALVSSKIDGRLVWRDLLLGLLALVLLLAWPAQAGGLTLPQIVLVVVLGLMYMLGAEWRQVRRHRVVVEPQGEIGR